MTPRSSDRQRGRVTRTVVAMLVIGFLIAWPEAARAVGQRADSATVRGKVQRQQQARAYPVANVRVTLTPKTDGARPRLSFTGSDGMFYFQGVPPGAHRLEVWGTDGKQVAARDVTVTRGQAYVDVAPITM
jgi:Carboxypeptidase regulatory-like domain